ncbi:MAG: serine acetyltransferase [Colwellia sp.]
MNGSDNGKPSKFDGGFYNAITFYRISNFFKRKKIPFIPKVFEGLTHFLFSSVIPGSAKIGKGTFCSHRGMAVVIHKNSVIGEDCVIGTSVVLGGRNDTVPGGPVLGDRVYIGTGAKIIGPIKVGSDVKIGANSVVLNDVPDGVTVVGIPGRILNEK